MESKDKKDVVNYIIETHDFNSGNLEDNLWTEIGRKDALDEAKAAYTKLLATHDTLRLVQETHTIIAQSCKAQKLIDELEQSLNEITEKAYNYLVTFLETVGSQYYSCNIRLTNDNKVVEMVLNNRPQSIKVIMFTHNKRRSCDLCQLSIKDQITILKAVTKIVKHYE